MEKKENNRHYKDRLFKFIFGNPEMKQNTLSLFNALNDKNFDNVEDLELNTLEDVIYMRMKNDVSFLYCSTLNLYEHQSSYNPNMPLRGLFYFSNLYERFVDEHKMNIYRRAPLTLPTPVFIVLYNGTDKKCEDEILKLSDLFAEPKKKRRVVST